MSNSFKDMEQGSQKENPSTSGQQTPMKGEERRTGQETNMDVRDGAEPESPGARSETPGSPNQGTESR